MPDERSRLLYAILALPPRAQEAWLERHTVGAPVGTRFFNWVLFAEGIADWSTYRRALAPSALLEDGRLNLRSASIALRVFESLAAREPTPDSCSLLESAMRLRARMIRDFGVRRGHAVLDADRIVKWCLRLIPEPDDASLLRFREEGDWPPSLERLRVMFNARRCCGVFWLMPGSGVWEDHPELHGLEKIVECYWPGTRSRPITNKR